MKEILMPHCILENDPEVVATYLAIKLNNAGLIRPESVALTMYGECKPNRYFLNKIKESLKKLADIEMITAVGKNDYIMSQDQLSVKPPFMKIEEGVFKKLADNPKLLVHYLMIKKGRSYQIEVNGKNSVVCCFPIEYFMEQEDVSDRTIIRYNKQLEDMKLIYINRSKYKVGNECREVNVYSLYEDREYADAYRPNYAKDNSKANDRRKVAALYNSYCKAPGKYSEKEKAEIREMVARYNEECEELGKLQPDYLSRIKDLDIFDLF
jgi:hypothetical protein